LNLITIDFETFYDVGFSLSNLTTEEYIRDPKFQVVGFAVKVDDGKTKWYSGSHEELKAELDKIDWDNSLLVCHNMLFDGAILSFIYNITPKIYLDTLCMARAIHGTNAGGSLAYLSKHYNLGEKGTEVLDAKGKRLEDFQPHELHRYGQYCINDTELTYKLFQVLSKDFPHNELKLIDITIRMFTEPLLEVNDGLLITRLEELKIETQELLQGLMARLECEDVESVRKKLASNKQFAELITELGAVVPMKESVTTGKQTFALAKTDQGFIDLQGHEDSFIQELCAVRLGTKSTIEKTRIERFIGVGARNKGRLPIPLKYYGAHTGRWSGSDKVNFQNLPSRDARKKTLKQAVVAPYGHKVINCDSSQIEARILVWLSGQEDVTQWYAEGRDVYCEFASKVYNRKIDKRNKVERAVGKTCILGLGYGTGAAKLQNVLKLGAGVEFDEAECKRLVQVYRNMNNKVTDFWQTCENALQDLVYWPEGKEPYYLDKHNTLLVDKEGIKFPNGLYIRYPDLHVDTSESNKRYLYKKRYNMQVTIWGGSVTENVVQALARIVIGEQMIDINEKYRPALTVHDAVVCVLPDEEVESGTKYIENIMSIAPEWADGLPIACESGVADNYGDC
jgi:DNA polymerase|tara:strand:- start:40 stop:1908 length:1869 start_codon:yes stop_codon:yes gene_type:complete